MRTTGSRRINPPDWITRKVVLLSDEEKAFVAEKIQKGLNGPEVQRMFFRKFKRDISVSYVRKVRIDQESE